jgi:hypothetical protein
MSRVSSVIMSDYGLETGVQFPEGAIYFSSSLCVQIGLALGPTQPPIEWVSGVVPPGVKRGRGVMLTTHPHLVPR